jgi:hypothetical protein
MGEIFLSTATSKEVEKQKKTSRPQRGPRKKESLELLLRPAFQTKQLN